MQLTTLLLSLTALSSLALVQAQTCTTDEDCSLNGICAPQTHSCLCDAGWFGSDCGHLDLAPATRWTGYNHTNYTDPTYYNTRGNSSWGGQIIQDRGDPALFHLLVDQFGHGCGLSAWRPTSFVARAESRTGPQGPYTWVQNVTGSFRHNAYVHWYPAEEKYLLWTIGVDVADPSSCKSVSKTSWPNNISVAAASSIQGPWSKFHITVNGTNPAPFPVLSASSHQGSDAIDSRIALAAEDLKIYVADRWDAAYKLVHTTPPWNTSDYSPTWTEDPFVWQDKRGHWHALAHWMIDIVEKKGTKYPRVGAHMFARTLQGRWNFKLHEAFNSTVAFTDGSVQTFNRRERPKVFFSEDGEMTPLYLVTGVQPLGTTALSYTLIQPIGSAWKEYEKRLGF
ncbi:uncharacterized protein K460DRAFT_364443 [Cucurbitaria berberidis CBS 394.84]|uniref:EGF-like domain-containing protein n=1 Tax=Cucurbitaria berberidis CBS 394.84 TaxID=1168544 RepID=A0A9P4LBK8_9PLEO|nr:uncharacterized protein K460DRAFT_364443 [Cucurbitaria berberidis CBS 394.84]KAF1848452.1 hypothetical protein K460DRAFT_364443 [Cucurbitaria berberidis CBS 394.84]